MRRVRKKKVANTTNNNTKGVINFLLVHGHSASRVNTQGQFEPVTPKYRNYKQISPFIATLRGLGLTTGFWRKSGSRRGYYDISACLKCKSGIGIFHVIDIKTGDDELSADQIKFKKEVEASGGIATEVETINDYIEYYETYLLPNIINKF